MIENPIGFIGIRRGHRMENGLGDTPCIYETTFVQETVHGVAE